MSWLQPHSKLLCCRTPKCQCLSTSQSFLPPVDLISTLLIFYFIVKEAIDLSLWKTNNFLEKNPYIQDTYDSLDLVMRKESGKFFLCHQYRQWALHLPSHTLVFLQRAAQHRELAAGRKNHGSGEETLMITTWVLVSWDTLKTKGPLTRIFGFGCPAKAEDAGGRGIKARLMWLRWDVFPLKHCHCQWHFWRASIGGNCIACQTRCDHQQFHHSYAVQAPKNCVKRFPHPTPPPTTLGLEGHFWGGRCQRCTVLPWSLSTCELLKDRLITQLMEAVSMLTVLLSFQQNQDSWWKRRRNVRSMGKRSVSEGLRDTGICVLQPLSLHGELHCAWVTSGASQSSEGVTHDEFSGPLYHVLLSTDLRGQGNFLSLLLLKMSDTIKSAFGSNTQEISFDLSHPIFTSW